MATGVDGSRHSLRETTLLVPSLHCPSCVSHIEEALLTLQPKPNFISHSIVSHSVTVYHDPSLLVPAISEALEGAGYEVYSVITDPSSTSPSSDATNAEIRSTQSQWLERAIQRWKTKGRDVQEGEKKRKRHIEHCDMCRAEEQADAKVTLSPSSTEEEKGTVNWRVRKGRSSADASTKEQNKGDPFVVVESDFSPAKTFQAFISITGMTCSSCVGKITRALEAKPWIHSVDISLLTNSASVRFEGEERLEELANIIDSAGYESTVEQVDEIAYPERIRSRAMSNVWRASYAIGGMSCSSCVGNLTRALEGHPWIRTVDVNLIANNATVVFEGKDRLRDIQLAVEEVGYEAKLDDVVDLSRDQVEDRRRTVAIRVNGMYCEHCPSRVQDALREFDQRVTIEKPLTMDEPILKIAYIPHSPNFTIRHILAAVSAADTAFEPSIFHLPTLEDRSQMMLAREHRRILLRVALSVTVAIPTLIIGIVFMTLVPSSNTSRQFLMRPLGSSRVSRAEWALFIMATPVYFFAADVFHRRAWKELRALWRPGSTTPILQRFYRFGSMDMLMSFGTTIAYFSSIAELAIAATRPSHMTSMMGNSSYFDSVIFLTMFLLIGRLIEAYSKAKTGDAVTMLGKLRPTEAILVTRDNNNQNSSSERATRQINVDLLELGDVVRVLHGGSPPCDGTVLEGESKFDESSLTGESRLVAKSIGDVVYSGTVNKDGPISVRISGVSGASMLDQIVKVVREGQTRRAPIERVADVLTSYFVPLVTLIALSTWIIWLALGLSGVLPENFLDTDVGGWPFWSLQFAIAVFIIACPCGIGLAAPTALFVGGGLAAQHGILAKGGGEAFQEASGLDCIVFDKTGTLTQGGEPEITDHEFLSRDGARAVDEETILGVLKRLEESSSHPIAKAAVSFCESRVARDVETRHIDEIAGKGMKGSFTTKTLQGQLVEALVGNEALMAEYKVDIPSEVIRTLGSWKTQGKSIAVVAARAIPDSQLPLSGTWSLSAIFAASDPLRPEAPAVIEALQKRGIDVWMLSGDNPMTACAVGDMVGIARENIIAGVLPDQKAEKIKYLQRSLKKSKSRSMFGRKHEYTDRRATVAMVGDGINDSPALTIADVGIAIGSGSDIAISCAEFVLISSSLTSLLTLIDLSRAVFTRIKFNFGWALLYNLLALPVAAGVLYPAKSNGAHIRLDPVWASLAMALSSVSVVCSSLLLRSRLLVIGFRPEKRILQ